ncbi:hypothetical protein N802_10000 [Knoellia sinensis KCTC 19936]|uniref:Uncharacterized protein n=1 Tax=Knoellia sinensis KCTC 19936 TaxID=1385520 RepID=A0A0A0J045_9MICO|nr:hypothetical protein N802_10000 [Knoellia sinensis KCTC 19936]
MRGAVVLVVVLIAGCSSTTETPRQFAPSPASQPPREVPSGTSAENVVPVDGEADGTTLLSPGRHSLRANGAADTVHLAVVDVPEGVRGYGGFALHRFTIPRTEPYQGLLYWTIAGVHADPCTKSGGLLDAGASVTSLADALARQALTTTTSPQPVSVDGHDGVRLDLVAPADIDFADCAEGYFDVWVSSLGGGRYLQAPGQRSTLWILDVDDQRVALEVSTTPGVSPDDVQVLTKMAESVTFVRAG